MGDLRYVAWAGYQLTKDSNVIGKDYGILEIEPGWAMLAIPIHYGWWDKVEHRHVHDGVTVATIKNYVVDQIEDVYNVQASIMVEVFNTLVGGQGNYWNFVPDITNESSPHNFLLEYKDQDVDSYEVTGFFIKSIYQSTFELKWGEQP